MSTDALLLGGLLAICLGVAAIFFVVDRGRHAGLSVFRRRAIASRGTPASATIVAERNVREVSGGGGTSVTAYVTEYLLDVTREGAQPFRATVTLPLLWSEQTDIKATKPLPVRVLDGIVVIDHAAVKAAVRAGEATEKAEKDRAFEKLRDEKR